MTYPARAGLFLRSVKDRIRVWLSRAGLRPGEYSGDYERLTRLYRRPDPWNLANAGDQARFEATNRLIADLAPDCPTLLELGAGEGMQTAHLTRLADRVTAIELSQRAINRGRRRVPDARFLQGRAEDVLTLTQGQRFAVATACEMLYYLPDAGTVLAALQKVADIIVVTNYARLDRKTAPLLTGPGWHRCADIRHGDAIWHCYRWPSPMGARIADRPGDSW